MPHPIAGPRSPPPSHRPARGSPTGSRSTARPPRRTSTPDSATPSPWRIRPTSPVCPIDWYRGFSVGIHRSRRSASMADPLVEGLGVRPVTAVPAEARSRIGPSPGPAGPYAFARHGLPAIDRAYGRRRSSLLGSTRQQPRVRCGSARRTRGDPGTRAPCAQQESTLNRSQRSTSPDTRSARVDGVFTEAGALHSQRVPPSRRVDTVGGSSPQQHLHTGRVHTVRGSRRSPGAWTAARLPAGAPRPPGVSPGAPGQRSGRSDDPHHRGAALTEGTEFMHR